MPTCCNLNCDGWSKKIRCGMCRKRHIHNCAICGDEVEVIRNKVFCTPCAAMSKLAWQNAYQNTPKFKKRIIETRRKHYQKHRVEIIAKVSAQRRKQRLNISMYTKY